MIIFCPISNKKISKLMKQNYLKLASKLNDGEEYLGGRFF
jgi:hypothetical protein